MCAVAFDGSCIFLSLKCNGTCTVQWFQRIYIYIGLQYNGFTICDVKYLIHHNRFRINYGTSSVAISNAGFSVVIF